MRFCVHCGAVRLGAEAFCMSCGRPQPVAPPDTPTGSDTAVAGVDAVRAVGADAPNDTVDAVDAVESPGRWAVGRWPTQFVAAWVALALVVAGTTVGVLVVRAAHAPDTGHRPDVGVVGPPTPTDFLGDQTDSSTPTDGTDTDEPTESSSTDGESTVADPAPTDPYGVVTLSAEAALDPAAPGVLALLSQYFQALNTHDYQLYHDLHAPDAQASLDPDAFRLGFESTQDSGATVTVIGVQVDGRPTAEVTFTSHQDSVDGPDGDTCDRWDITLFLEPDGSGNDQYLITTPPSTYHASHQPC